MNHTLVHDTPFALEGASLRHLEPAGFERGLAGLRPGRTRGTWTSPRIEALFPFSELVLSANASLPPGSELGLEVSVLHGTAWGAWRQLGRVSSAGGGSPRRSREVDVDTLVLERPAKAFRYRISLSRRRGSGEGPVVRLVAAAYGDRRPPSRYPAARRGRSVALDVPARSQMTEPENVRGDICSPASVGMTLEYWGKTVPTLRIASAVRDATTGIFGNWFLNTAWAGRFLDAYVAKFGGLEELEDELSRGRPVVCSVSFGPGELRGAPIPKTRGHLLVVRGMDADGDFLVNDPAAPDKGTVRRVYRRAEFADAWLKNKRGVAYLLAPRFPKELAVAVPLADLRKRPGQTVGRRDKGLESQLLLGESVQVLEAKGAWALVRALDQPTSGGPYRGWVPASALARRTLPPDLAVASPFAAARLRGKKIMLPAGSLLRDLGPAERGARWALLPGDRVAKVGAAGLRSLSGAAAGRARIEVLGAARRLAGEPYAWGGAGSRAAGGRGLDCSGLVMAAYRSAGLRLPRNAQDQWEAASPVRRPSPADLAFLSEPGRPSRITHVMIVAEGGRLLEAEGAADRVRETDFETKLGVPFRLARPGRTYHGRTLYYGSFLAHAGGGPRRNGRSAHRR